MLASVGAAGMVESVFLVSGRVADMFEGVDRISGVVDVILPR